MEVNEATMGGGLLCWFSTNMTMKSHKRQITVGPCSCVVLALHCIALYSHVREIASMQFASSKQVTIT